MSYFMIVIIWYSSGTIETKIPFDNYEHCMEVREYVIESLQDQLSSSSVTAVCLPIQP